MRNDIAEILRHYELLLSRADSAFAQVRETHGDCVRCGLNCCDCCYAVFELFHVEAVYLNHHFHRCLQREERREVLRRAESALAELTRIKEAAGGSGGGMLALAEARVRCPLLNDGGRCVLYEYRPVTCRLYGIPTAIEGKGVTCGKSGFSQGTVYPTVNWDVIHDRMFALSEELLQLEGAGGGDKARQLVPVAVALGVQPK